MREFSPTFRWPNGVWQRNNGDMGVDIGIFHHAVECLRVLAFGYFMKVLPDGKRDAKVQCSSLVAFAKLCVAVNILVGNGQVPERATDAPFLQIHERPLSEENIQDPIHDAGKEQRQSSPYRKLRG